MSIFALRSVMYLPACASSTAGEKKHVSVDDQPLTKLQASEPEHTLLVSGGEHNGARLVAHDALSHLQWLPFGSPSTVHNHLRSGRLSGWPLTRKLQQQQQQKPPRARAPS
jgi:hypothetical protein